MTPAPTSLGSAEGFCELLAQDPSKSTGLAAIETLLTALENSNGNINENTQLIVQFLLQQISKWSSSCS